MEYLHLLRQFLTDILKTDSWISLKTLVDISLKNLEPNMMELQLGARASSTMRKYRAAWLKWRTWTLSKIDVPVIPAQPAHVALFIYNRACKHGKIKGLGFSTLGGAVYGIAWAHKMGGLNLSSTDHPLVKRTLSDAKRAAYPNLSNRKSHCLSA